MAKIVKTTQLISELTTQKDWDKIYQISEFFGQEISILVDAQERIFVDWEAYQGLS